MTALKEHDIQKEILNYLWKQGIFHWRNNSGCSTIQDRFVQFGYPGSPDIIAVIKGQFVGIEVKGPKGKQSHDQMRFQEELELAGGRYLLVRSLEEVINSI